MPFAWDCRNTEAAKTKGVKENIGNYAYTLGISFMKMKKVSYPNLYLYDLEITEDDVDEFAKYITDVKILINKDTKEPMTLQECKTFVKLFIGATFTRT